MTFEIIILRLRLRLKDVLELIVGWVLPVALRWVLQEVLLDVFLLLADFHVH